jgi:leader peptidase (prepilin peptidase)/N-methyltransferase
LIIVFALIGLIVGGLINLLADALPNRKPLASIGSLFRWPMPIRNLMVEVGTAIMFAFIYLQPVFADPIKLILAGFHMAVLILVTVTDLEHRLILNKVMFPAIAVAALTSWLWFWHEYWYVAFIGGAIGFAFFWLAVVVGGRLFGRGAMSAGDVTLAAYVGLITGFPGIITALVITILAGGIISVLLLLLRVVNLRSGIPYGPFLVVGGFVSILWGAAITTGFFFR